MPSTEGELYFNGVDGVTGRYLLPTVSLATAAEFAVEATKQLRAREPWLPELLRNLWARISKPDLYLPPDVDPLRIDQAGWGIVFHVEEADDVRRALKPLIEHRRSQVGPARTKVLEVEGNEDWREWLAYHGSAPGGIDPEQVPYYLLIVGSPEVIPFTFGHLLDIEYAVGRICFDTADEYAAYADSIIRYERGTGPLNSREIAFFAPQHQVNGTFDRATQLSSEYLITPLAEGIRTLRGGRTIPSVAAKHNYRVQKVIRDAATKASLHELWRSERGRAAAITFTASHGIGLPPDNEHQRSTQGALLCQDWPGPGSISRDHYYAAADLPEDASLEGRITFHFACYSAGTPRMDRFFHTSLEMPSRIAPEAFLASLPTRLLCFPGGGALASIGHVERAWGYSIAPADAGVQLLPFQNALSCLMRGEPVGHAMKDFNLRYAALSADVAAKLDASRYQKVPVGDLAVRWVERNDAEGYIVIGDPAVRIRPDATE